MVTEQEKREALKEKKPKVYAKMLNIKDYLDRGIGRPIIQLQWDYRCNFRCEHCCTEKMLQRQLQQDTRVLTLVDVKKLADQADALKLPTFVITGGEPLLFKDLEALVAVIGPERFWITIDTNGWLLNDKMAKYLKNLGIDKVQLSVDGSDAETHDSFRHKPGSWRRCINATKACKKAWLDIIWQTVVWRGRPQTEEFEKFLQLAKEMEVGVYVGYAKPIGEYEGRYDMMVTLEDEEKLAELQKTYNLFMHWTPAFGLDIGCIAVKRMISITKFGSVWPCPFMHSSLGNVLNEPLEEIIKRGMNIPWFRMGVKGPCWMGKDRRFIECVQRGELW